MTFNELEFRSEFAGKQARVSFPNGYGASIVQSAYSYGGSEGFYEIAVIGKDGALCYTTPITDDVIGWLTEEKVTEILQAIEALSE